MMRRTETMDLGLGDDIIKALKDRGGTASLEDILDTMSGLGWMRADVYDMIHEMIDDDILGTVRSGSGMMLRLGRPER